MTLEEKAAQNGGRFPTACAEGGSAGLGAKGRGFVSARAGDDAREVQSIAAFHTGLGIPVLFGIDAHPRAWLERTGYYFSKPACRRVQLESRSWWRRMGRVTAREVATDGLHWTFFTRALFGARSALGARGRDLWRRPVFNGGAGRRDIRGYQGKRLGRQREHSSPAPSTISAMARRSAGATPAIRR